MYLSNSLTLLAVVSLLFAPTSAEADGAWKRRPFDLQRLEELQRLSAVDRVTVGYTMLREEVEAPSPTGKTYTGETIGHADVLARMVLTLSEQSPDLETLQGHWRRAPAGELRAALALTLGLLGDRTVAGALATSFADQKQPPALRLVAAKALARVPDPKHVPLLANVLATDSTYRLKRRRDRATRATVVTGKSLYVREAALALLRSYQESGIPLNSDVRQLMQQCVLELPPDRR